jgi:hypothetical protein
MAKNDITRMYTQFRKNDIPIRIIDQINLTKNIIRYKRGVTEPKWSVDEIFQPGHQPYKLL